MSIDEAIKHSEEVVSRCETDTDWGMGNHFIDRSGVADVIKCGQEHRQLAEWLKDYKRLLEQEEWIPVKYHQATEQEIEENGYPFDVCYIFDNIMPCDEEEILVTVAGRSGKRYVNQDTCYYDDGYSLDSGYDWITDILAWKPLDKPWEGIK